MLIPVPTHASNARYEDPDHPEGKAEQLCKEESSLSHAIMVINIH